MWLIRSDVSFLVTKVTTVAFWTEQQSGYQKSMRGLEGDFLEEPMNVLHVDNFHVTGP